jgi:DNA helicase-2/ATP-dependent DNA helicase PcrA
VRLLRERPDILGAERRRVRHLLIDEYQDTNAAQDALVKLLGEGADSLCAVGDEDQAIYRWRGAEVEHILRFDEDFPGARTVALETNYRSTDGIPARRVGVVRTTGGAEKTLRADRARARSCAWPHFEEDRQETEAVARAIAEAGRRPGDVAILYRVNAQSRPFGGRGARAAEDPVHRRRRSSTERLEVGRTRSRTCARGPAGGRPGVPARRERSRRAALARPRSTARRPPPARRAILVEVSGDPPAGLSDRARVALSRFRALVEDLRTKAQTYSPSALIEYLFEATGYAALYESSEDKEDEGRRENLQELLNSAREFERRNAEGATVAEYLDTVSLATDADVAATSGGAVTLRRRTRQGAGVSGGLHRGARGGLLRTESRARTRRRRERRLLTRRRRAPKTS